jgi:uroporphyrinogen decarboxylase
MFTRQDQDRVPRHDTFWSATIARWQAEGLDGGVDAALDTLESDFRPVCWSMPVPFPGLDEVVSEDAESETIRDMFGNIIRRSKDGQSENEYLRFGCVDRDDWDQTYKPLMVTAGLHVDVDSARVALAEGKRRGQWTFFSACETLQMARQMLGEETTLIAMGEEPDFIRDVSSIYTDLVLRDLQALYDNGVQPDGLWVFGDMAYNYGPICSPRMYRELIWPDHVRLVEWAHSHKMPVIYHSDGNVMPVMDMYVLAGFDCIHPLESRSSMSLRDVTTKYGAKLATFGNIDVDILATNDASQIEQEIASKLEIGKSTRSYAYHSDHSVPPTVTWETYKLVIGLLNHHGYYE